MPCPYITGTACSVPSGNTLKIGVDCAALAAVSGAALAAVSGAIYQHQHNHEALTSPIIKSVQWLTRYANA